MADGLAVLDYHLARDEEELERLEDIDPVTGDRAVDAEGKVTVVAEWAFVTVETEISLPEEVAAVACHEREDGVEDDAGAPA